MISPLVLAVIVGITISPGLFYLLMVIFSAKVVLKHAVVFAILSSVISVVSAKYGIDWLLKQYPEHFQQIIQTTEQSLNDELLKQSIFRTIKQRYPEDYKKHVDTLAKEGEWVTPRTKKMLNGQFINKTFMKSMLSASDASIQNYLNNQVQMFEYIETIDPEAVFVLVYQTKEHDDKFSKLMTDEKYINFKLKMLEAKELIINESRTEPSEPLNEEMAIEILTDIMQSLIESYGDRNVYNTLVEPSKNNNMTIGSKIIIDNTKMKLQQEAQNRQLIMRYEASTWLKSQD